MTADAGSLTQVLEQFLTVFRLGQQGVAGEAWSLLSTLAVIELTLMSLWWALSGQDAIVPLLRKILVIGFFVFVVQNYPRILSSVVDGFIHTGKTASSAGSDNLGAVRDPSIIIDAGFQVAQPVLEYIKSYAGWDVLTHLHDIAISGICALGILLSYFIIAIQVFVTYLEFAIISTLGLILIPFGVFKHTAFLTEKVFGSIISFGVKLMVLGLLVSVTVPVLKSFTLPPDPTWTQLFNLLVVCFANAALAWHAPGVAAGMLIGSPTLTAGTAAGTAVAGAAAGAGTAMLGTASTSAPFHAAGSLTKSAASALGIAAAGAKVGLHNSNLSGGSTLSKVTKAATGSVSSTVNSVIGAPMKNLGNSITTAFQSKQSSVPGYDAIRLSKSTPQTPANPLNIKGETQSPGSIKPAKQSGENLVKSHLKTASGLHIAKESIPHTAQPIGGMRVPLKTEEEPKL